MREYLDVLESAISDVGRWAWWTATLPEAFQIEFDATQLWNPPRDDGQPPSGQIALRFRNPRLIYFLTLTESVSTDWPDRLQRDELALRVDHDAFTLTEAERCHELMAKALCIDAIVGEPGITEPPSASEVFIGFTTGDVGLVVAAETLAIFNHLGELDAQAVVASNRKWWDYWREYWRLIDSENPLPTDFACEVTIPAAPDQ